MGIEPNNTSFRNQIHLLSKSKPSSLPIERGQLRLTVKNSITMQQRPGNRNDILGNKQLTHRGVRLMVWPHFREEFRVLTNIKPFQKKMARI